MTGIRSKVVTVGVAALALAVAACGSAPTATWNGSVSTSVPLHGIFADASPSNPSSDGSSCASIEGGSYRISAKADGETRAASLTFGNTLPGYAPAGTLAQSQTWLCIGHWSVTVPSSAAGWVFTLNSPNGRSSVTVPASDSGTSIALDDGGGNGDLELTPNSDIQLELTATRKAAAKAAAAARAAAARAARIAGARRARAAAARAAQIAAEDTPISADLWADVIRNPDNYTGDIYTITGTVSQYNLDSNSLAEQPGDEAALVAEDYDGNQFVVEGTASVLGSVQPGDTFTAKVTVVGAEEVENTTYGGTSEVPDFDASTFTVTG